MKKEDFDYTDAWNEGELTLEYACVSGSERIVFIKAGLGGDYFGYENKYLRIAHLLHEKYGCTVVCVSNPHDKRFDVRADMDILNAVILRHGFQSPELYLFGNSNGCYKGLALAQEMKFKRAVLVNMPMTINFHRTKRFLMEIPQTEVLAVFGEKDISYPYAALLEGKRSGQSVLRIPDADHQFIGKTEEFIRLAERLFETVNEK